MAITEILQERHKINEEEAEQRITELENRITRLGG